MNFFPSWKALYGKLAADKPELSAFKGYAEFLKYRDSTDRTITNLTRTPHAAILVICSHHKVKIIHHFYQDVNTPVFPEGTDELWALLGGGATAAPIQLPTDAFRNHEAITPCFNDIHGTKTVEELRALSTPTRSVVADNPTLTFQGKLSIAIPPFLTKILMDADTEDAFKLLKACCKALKDFDERNPAYTPTTDVNMAQVQETNNDSAKSVFFRVVQFLTIAVQGTTTNPVQLEVLSTSRPSDWARSIAAECGVATTGGGSPTGDLDRGLTSLGTSINRFTDQLQKQQELLENKSEKKSKSGKDKLPEFVRQMIFNASEPIPGDATDDDGNPITERSDLVSQYAILLECPSAGLMRQHLHHYMNDKHKCSATLPLSTCVAIHMGKLRWDSVDIPEAFSLLACYHWSASAAEASQFDGADAVSMHLRASEGNGISDADVQRATKVVLLAPRDIDVLGKQLGIFAVICGAIFGTKSQLVRELYEWIKHILDHETTYKNLQARDPTFATKLACFIDRKIQLHLMECSKVTVTRRCLYGHVILHRGPTFDSRGSIRCPMDPASAQQTGQDLVNKWNQTARLNPPRLLIR